MRHTISPSLLFLSLPLLLSCDLLAGGEMSSPNDLNSLHQACMDLGGSWDEEAGSCTPADALPTPASWLVLQQADSVSFAFDDQYSGR